MKVTCWLEKTDGKYKKLKSKDGSNFTWAGGNYRAPKADNHEILHIKQWWGDKYYAFYKQGITVPMPVGISDAEAKKWLEKKLRNYGPKDLANLDGEGDFLATKIRVALLENAKIRQALYWSAISNGSVIIGLFIHHFLSN